MPRQLTIEKISNISIYQSSTGVGETSHWGLAQKASTEGIDPFALGSAPRQTSTDSVDEKHPSVPCEVPMKIRLVVILVGLAINFALPTLAQQTSTPDPKLRQKLVEVIEKQADAMNKNDAAAAAACFTKEAVYVTDRGPVSGREAIEKWYADLFKKVQFTYYVITIDQDSPHIISTAGNEIWAAGGWSSTIKGENFEPRQIKGYWAVIRVDDDWKIRMLSSNSTPESAISFAWPTFAERTDRPDPQLRQKLVDVIAKHADALNKNDAAAAAACFTEDAVLLVERGPVNGRKAIEKWYADLSKYMKQSDVVVTIDQDSPHLIGTASNEIWATGGWSSTLKGENFGPVRVKGYWSVIRVGNDWKIRMLNPNTTPAN
jgi:uncharacterized protein (TIGR02246 family)